MRLGILFSGGKDSCAALQLARGYGHDVACLLAVRSANAQSFLFHTPNIALTALQAAAADVPLLVQETQGEEELELHDLRTLLVRAIGDHAIEGVVTGAIGSVYQASRIQSLCADLGLWVFNPLWQRDEEEHLAWLLAEGFEIVVAGIAAYPLTRAWLGRRLDAQALEELRALRREHHVSPAGEGGELETFVTHAPGWRSRIAIGAADVVAEEHSGTYHIADAVLAPTSPTVARKNPPHHKLNENNGPGSGSSRGDVLVVSLCAEPLSEREFVDPIVRIAERAGRNVRRSHYAEIAHNALDGAGAIVLCGTALQDDGYAARLDRFAWLSSCEIPVLGICAGMQVLGLVAGGSLRPAREIGLFPETFSPFLGLEGERAVWHLHQSALVVPDAFAVKAGSAVPQAIAHRARPHFGVLFHPEVRCENVIENFLDLVKKS